MELEQIQKKLDWLDAERRQDKDTIAGLEISINAYQKEINKLTKRISDLEGELAHALPVADQLTVLDEKINGVRIELTRSIEQTLDKRNTEKETSDQALSKRFLQVEQEIEDVRGQFSVIATLEDQVEVRKDEEFKLRRMVVEIEEKLEQKSRDDESWLRTINLLEDGRRKDSTRLVELQADLDSVRKKLEEQAGKVDVATENIRKMDQRIAEIRQAEIQRNQEQHAFTEKQSLSSMELARDWKKVQTNFESFMEKFATYEKKMAEISILTQSLANSQETFDSNNDRIEQRIHEVTELHRLNREQFLADWEAFQGAEKHRWSQFMVDEEERRKDQARKSAVVTEQMEKLGVFTQQLSDEMKKVQKDLHGFWRNLIENAKDSLPKE